MKHATVRRSRDFGGNYRPHWTVTVATRPDGMTGHITWRDSHAEAMKHAIEQVGLAPTNPEPMEAR